MRYAKAVNDRKIFRDIENENYDPFELEGTGVQYNAKHLLDPMKHDLEKVLTLLTPPLPQIFLWTNMQTTNINHPYDSKPPNGENWLLVPDELVEFEK